MPYAWGIFTADILWAHYAEKKEREKKGSELCGFVVL
jgi:hypothetical protein